MTITYNNQGGVEATNLVTFSDIPNLLKVEDTSGGTKSLITLTVSSGWKSATHSNGQWWLSLLGETITNVTDPLYASNKNFYIASTSRSTAASITKALRCCPSIVAKYQVYLDKNQAVSKIYLKARDIGKVDVTMTMADNMSTYLSTSATSGSATSTLYGSKVSVDVYSDDDYITTLEKNYYGSSCTFDMTPVLSTLSEGGKTVPYSLYLSSLSPSGNSESLGSIVNNYTTVGYACNQGSDFLNVGLGITIAQNVGRGKMRNAYNNTILYIYNDSPMITFYSSTSGDVTYSKVYKDSSNAIISSEDVTVTIDGSSNKLHYIIPSVSFPSNCFYFELTIGGKTLRYNVIKPLNTSYGCQRLEWRNSYGGVSFFDFVGERTETKEMTLATYQRNNFDYYTATKKEKEKIYNNDVKYTISVKSHLIEKDGIWVFNDLMQSPDVWTNINGTQYGVIIDNVSVSEIDKTNVYEATVKFHLSQEPSN